MLPTGAIHALCQGRHGDPFAVLGPHADETGVIWVRTFQPGAVAVEAVLPDGSLDALERRHGDGIFEGKLTREGAYRLRVHWPDGTVQDVEDPYRFGQVLGEMDVWLLGEGTHLRPYEILGAHPRRFGDIEGTSFAVWAPNASRVSVVGDFNQWDGRRHPMRLRRECGVWELFIPGLGIGTHYKFELLDHHGRLLPQKADPFARRAELRPATASIVSPLPERVPPSPERERANAHEAPMSIYEVHLGSWRRHEGWRWLNWDELADQLVPYAAGLGFTHLELLPISEHPFDGSWGYQTLGLFAPSARFGDPTGLTRFVERAHAAGLGVIIDWVPAHFPTDAWGLARFDGTALYEHADPREGWHPDWDTYVYNFGRTEVRNFLVASALYWLERFNVDGLRVDAVASMLYRDYSRKAGEWIPNMYGGNENLEAISFLKRFNEVVGAERPQALTLAEESTAFARVSRPVWSGGLGFHCKWNMGWMHDTLRYISRDPIYRAYHHNELTFGLIYAFDENFVLPLSHDEVVHGKGSLLGKMPGDRWQKFANLRLFYGYMWGHPGKKLLFMGSEFAQEREWSHDQSLDWHLLEDPAHAGVQRLVGDLNRLHRECRALHEMDFTREGFEWIDHGDAPRNMLSFIRRGRDGSVMLVVCNFSPVVHRMARFGVPLAGNWVERLNTDSDHYGGSNVGLPFGSAAAEPVPCHGRAQSVVVDIPPLAAIYLQWAG